MITVLRFWIILTICVVVEKTMAQQCPSERSISGWMLQRHVYKTMLVDIGLHCLLSCSTDYRCQSFNFVMSSHMCEFSDRTKEATPEDFIRDPDRYYFGKRVNRGNLNIIDQFVSDKNLWSIFSLIYYYLVPLGSTPELAAKSCKEIKMSEKEAITGKYWLSSIKPSIPLFSFCNMAAEGKGYITSIYEILSVFIHRSTLSFLFFAFFFFFFFFFSSYIPSFCSFLYSSFVPLPCCCCSSFSSSESSSSSAFCPPSSSFSSSFPPPLSPLSSASSSPLLSLHLCCCCCCSSSSFSSSTIFSSSSSSSFFFLFLCPRPFSFSSSSYSLPSFPYSSSSSCFYLTFPFLHKLANAEHQRQN